MITETLQLITGFISTESEILSDYTALRAGAASQPAHGSHSHHASLSNSIGELGMPLSAQAGEEFPQVALQEVRGEQRGEMAAALEFRPAGDIVLGLGELADG